MESPSNPTSVPTPTKSTFVTVVAWIFIVLSGFATFISLMQNIMIHTMFKSDKMAQAMEAQPPDGMPAFAEFMLRHVDLFFLLFFIVTLTCFISSIGLLKRKNWARLIFIGLMSLAILWNLGGLILQFTFFINMIDMAQMPPDHAAEMQNVMAMMRIFTSVFTLALCVIFGVIIKKLTSRSIKPEFT